MTSTRICGMLLLAIASISYHGVALSDPLPSLNGRTLDNLTKQLGNSDKSVVSGNGTVHAWLVTRTTQEAATNAKQQPITRPVLSNCILRVMIINGKVTDTDIDGDLLACASIKMSLGL